MKSVRLALLLVAVCAGAALAGPGVVALAGDSGVECPDVPDTPAPDAPAPDVPAPDASPAEETPEPDDCEQPEDPSEDGEEGDTETPPVERPEPEEPADDDVAEAGHGKIVSTVAHCAPRGKDTLFDLLPDFRNHGAFVRQAAHGESLSLNGTDYNLSTLAGADALCAALETLVASQDPADEDDAADDKGKDKRKKHKSKKSKRSRH